MAAEDLCHQMCAICGYSVVDHMVMTHPFNGKFPEEAYVSDFRKRYWIAYWEDKKQNCKYYHEGMGCVYCPDMRKKLGLPPVDVAKSDISF